KADQSHQNKCRRKEGRQAQTQQRILHLSAIEARNHSAAQALETYFRLAESEAQTDLLQQTFAQLDDAIAQTENLIKQGVRSPIEVDVLRRQLVDAQTQGAKLQFQVEQLNSELRRRLGLDPNPVGWHFWPVAEFQLNEEPADIDAAVALGLEN